MHLTFLRISAGAALIFMALPAYVFASGFYTPEIGPRALGRGGAFIAGVDDGSAIYLNPAGLTRVKSTNLLLANNFDVFHTHYQREPHDPVIHNQNPLDVIQLAVFSWDFGIEQWTFALGVYGPYGVGEKYDADGPQRYSTVEIDRTQLYYMAGAAWKPLDWLRVGAAAGVGEFSQQDTYAYSVFEDDNPNNDVIAEVTIEQFGNPMAALGVIFGPFYDLEFGLSYQPPTDIRLEGIMEAKLPPLFAALMGYKTYTDDITVKLKFPQIFRMGARYFLTPKFDVEFATVYTGWSRFKEQDIDFKKEELIDDMVVETGWRDTWDFRLGGEYRFIPEFSVRAGGWYDQSATPESHLEPGSIEMPRWAACVGLGHKWKGMSLDLAYSHIWMESVEVTEDELHEVDLGDGRGKYWGSYDMFVVGINFDFHAMADAFGD